MNITKSLLSTALIFSFVGCSTTEKFSVYAPQGTKIYTPNNTASPKGMASTDEKINIEIPSEMYCGYVLAQPLDSDVRIPIGLDYKTNRHTGTKVALYAGGTLTSIGVAASALGAICMLVSSGDEDMSDTFGTVVAVGAATAGVGAVFTVPSGSRLAQTTYDYNFGYVNNQRLSIPKLSYTLINPNPPKDSAPESSEKKSIPRKKATSGKEIVQEVPISSKASASRSDNAKKIEGSYIGTGTLLFDKNVDEKYDDISVVVKRIDRNHVSIRIIESGEDYFDSPLTYEIQKGKKGNYVLKISNLPEATISISPAGKLAFEHRKVNIDNQIYTLKIAADKE